MKQRTPLTTRFARALTTTTATAALLCAFQSPAWPLGRTTFYTDAPFMGASGVPTLTATGMQNLLTVAGWADQDATVPANLYQWWWIFGVDSGTGNGALLDGTESMTLQFEPSVGAAMLSFFYTGGSGGTTNNLARLSISGFASDPGATAVTYYNPLISNLSYAAGTLTFDYLNDGPGQDYGQLLFANPQASAGKTLKITGAVSPRGDATSWYAALYRVDVQEAFAGPHVSVTSIPHNSVGSFTTADGLLVIKAYADRNAITPGNLGRHQDECFGVYGQNGGNVVDTNEAITLQFASGVGLSRLDSVYSSGEFSIAGLADDPGFVDPSGGATSAVYAGGVLTVTVANGSLNSFYFTNRSASAGQTLRITVADVAGNQLGLGGIGYDRLQTVLAPDLAGNTSSTLTAPDGVLTLDAYADTPGATPASFGQSGNWLGIFGGNNNQAIDGTESLTLQLTGAGGLSALGTRYTSGQVVLSGFTSDPGFNDPSGTATGVSYSGGTLSYTFNAPTSPERVVTFSNLAASRGQALSLHTDGAAGSQLALTRLSYASTQVQVSLTRHGNDVVVSWPAGTLQIAPAADGPYRNVLGASNPYTNTLSTGTQFFRVKVQ